MAMGSDFAWPSVTVKRSFTVLKGRLIVKCNSCWPESIFRHWTAPRWSSPSKQCYWIPTRAKGWLEPECSINKWRTARQDPHSSAVVLRPTSQAVWRQVSFICTHTCIYCHRVNIWSHVITDFPVALQVYPLWCLKEWLSCGGSMESSDHSVSCASLRARPTKSATQTMLPRNLHCSNSCFW